MISARLKLTTYIAKKIKGLRESVGWSQSELARHSGVTSAAISQIEKGNRLPSLIVSRKIAEAFNVSEDELTGNILFSPSEINEEHKVFFRKFGDIKDLSDEDQKMIELFVKRLKKQGNKY